jgi:hypothetical protein
MTDIAGDVAVGVV